MQTSASPILDELGFSRFVDNTEDSKEITSPIHGDEGMRKLTNMTQPNIYLYKPEQYLL